MTLNDKKDRALRALSGNDSGIILLVVLWSLVILSVLSASLGRGTSLEFALTRHAIARAQSRALAWAGLMFSLDAIREDSRSDEYRNIDTLYRCGTAFDGAGDARSRFGSRALGEGVFDVMYLPVEDVGTETVPVYGFQDEERRINLNAVSPREVNILVQLIQLLGFDEVTAAAAAHSLVDWRDADDVVSQADYGAESDYYQDAGRPYEVKNRPLDSLEELLLVRGFNRDLWRALRPYVTIFPREGGALKINFDTAAPLVLRAVARSVSGPASGTDAADADALVEKMIAARNGVDGVPGTADDQALEMNDLPLNTSERSIFLSVQGLRTRKSDYFRVRSVGQVALRGAVTTIEAVVRREDLSILSWMRE